MPLIPRTAWVLALVLQPVSASVRIAKVRISLFIHPLEVKHAVIEQRQVYRNREQARSRMDLDWVLVRTGWLDDESA